MNTNYKLVQQKLGLIKIFINLAEYYIFPEFQ